jgi:transposase-like protein
MAELDVKFHEGSVEIISHVFWCDLHDTWENRKAWVVILRSVCSLKTGKPLFRYQRMADAFGEKTRQNSNNDVREDEQWDANLVEYLRHKRKVDPVVVEAGRDEFGRDGLVKTGEVRMRVNQRLGREDLPSATIRVAFEHIPCTVVRARVVQEIAEGAFHPREEVGLAELFAAVEHGDVSGNKRAVGAGSSGTLPGRSGDSGLVKGAAAVERGAASADGGEALSAVSREVDAASGKLWRDAEVGSAAGGKALHEEPDEAVIEKIQSESVGKLLTPELALSEIPESVSQMVKAMTRDCSGASFSRIGWWVGGKAKSTGSTWVIGLAFAVWPLIRGWVWAHVRGTRQSIDEKWVKIHNKWHDLVVSVDHDSGLPVFHDLLPTRTKWACRVCLLKLKRLGKLPSGIITDGLQGSVSAIANVFPAARHLVGLFHHQQSVTRCVNTPFCETEQEEAKAAKKRMKRVGQTHDARTVNRRLDRLEQAANEKGWKILEWITWTRDKLKHLLPVGRSHRSPSPTNTIVRVFRAYARFYKTRCGCHSVTSANREIMFFLVVYLFTIQAESGKAPIENILPEANPMPFYRLLNDPFALELTSYPPPQHVKPIEDMATESAEEVAYPP